MVKKTTPAPTREQIILTHRVSGPDFLVIGAQRAGTSWLYRVLRQHPELWLPPLKELHYFDKIGKPSSWNGQKKSRRLRGRFGTSLGLGWWDFRYFFGTRNDEWYAKLFQEGRCRGRVAGEVTPAYAVLSEDRFRRIQQINPRVKLIFIMRDPVERAWSAVNRAAARGRLEGNLSIEAAIEGARKRRADSMYIDTVSRIESIFPAAQLHYCFFEDLAEKPVIFVSSILKFLGVTADDPNSFLPAGAAANRSSRRKPVPIEFEQEIAKDLLPSMRALCTRFDGPPQRWRERYEALVKDSDW